MRAIAALIVVFGHMRDVFFVSFQQAGDGRLVRFIYIDHYVARAAVIFFFALSGYLVGTSVLRSVGREAWSWASYLLNRLSRLWTVLIPALLLSALLDWLGKNNSIAAPAYFALYPGTGVSFARLDSVRSFWGTMFFVQNILTGVYGTLGPAWSLANEFWYYMLFPLAVLCIVRPKPGKKVLYGILFVLAAWFIGKELLLPFGTWLAGVLAGWLARRYPIRSALQRRGLFAAALVLTLLSIVGSAAHWLNLLAGDCLLAPAAAGLIWAALCTQPGGKLYGKLAIFLSELSYTLYLTHQPVLVLLSALWLQQRRWPPDPAHLIFSVVPIGFAVLCAYVMYFLFESRTDAVRRFAKANLLDRFMAHLPSATA
jgi:peptidoglycan/LPS O-acetylase OafA/YrhL